MAASSEVIKKKVESERAAIAPKKTTRRQYTPNEVLFLGIRDGRLGYISKALAHGAQWSCSKFNKIPLFIQALMSDITAIKQASVDGYMLPLIEEIRKIKTKSPESLMEQFVSALRMGDEFKANFLLSHISDLANIPELFYLAIQNAPSVCPALLHRGVVPCDIGEELLSLKTIAIKLGFSGKIEAVNYQADMEGWHKGYAIREMNRSLSTFKSSLTKRGAKQACIDTVQALLVETDRNFREAVRSDDLAKLGTKSLEEIRQELLTSDKSISYKIENQTKAGISMYRCSWAGHMFDLVVDWDNQRLAFCNRGTKIGQEISGVTVFEGVDFSNFDNAILNTSLHAFIANPAVFNTYLTQAFGVTLDASMEPAHTIEMMPQDVGNCPWASLEAGLIGYFYLSGLSQGLSSDKAEEFSVNLFRQWYLFETERTLLEFHWLCQESELSYRSKISMMESLIAKYGELVLNRHLEDTLRSIRALERTSGKRLSALSGHLLYECWFEERQGRRKVEELFESGLLTPHDAISASEDYAQVCQHFVGASDVYQRCIKQMRHLLELANVRPDDYPMICPPKVKQPVSAPPTRVDQQVELSTSVAAPVLLSNPLALENVRVVEQQVEQRVSAEREIVTTQQADSASQCKQ